MQPGALVLSDQQASRTSACGAPGDRRSRRGIPPCRRSRRVRRSCLGALEGPDRGLAESAAGRVSLQRTLTGTRVADGASCRGGHSRPGGRAQRQSSRVRWLRNGAQRHSSCVRRLRNGAHRQSSRVRRLRNGAHRQSSRVRRLRNGAHWQSFCDRWLRNGVHR